MSDVGKVGTIQIPPSTRPVERDEALLPTHAVERVSDDESDHRERGRAAHDAARFAHRHDQPEQDDTHQDAEPAKTEPAGAQRKDETDHNAVNNEHVDTFV